MQAVYEVNAFVKRLLASNVQWSNSTDWPVAHRISIIPAQEQPEQANQTSEVPYIVYDYVTTPSTGVERKVDEVSYTIRHQDTDLIDEIVGVLTAAFDGEDDSASLAHQHTISTSYNFYYFQVPYVYSPEPEEEGGRYSTVVVLRYDYAPVQRRIITVV